MQYGTTFQEGTAEEQINSWCAAAFQLITRLKSKLNRDSSIIKDLIEKLSTLIEESVDQIHTIKSKVIITIRSYIEIVSAKQKELSILIFNLIRESRQKDYSTEQLINDFSNILEKFRIKIDV